MKKIKKSRNTEYTQKQINQLLEELKENFFKKKSQGEYAVDAFFLALDSFNTPPTWSCVWINNRLRSVRKYIKDIEKKEKELNKQNNGVDYAD